jgi:hypothetical protein
MKEYLRRQPPVGGRKSGHAAESRRKGELGNVLSSGGSSRILSVQLWKDLDGQSGGDQTIVQPALALKTPVGDILFTDLEERRDLLVTPPFDINQLYGFESLVVIPLA